MNTQEIAIVDKLTYQLDDIVNKGCCGVFELASMLSFELREVLESSYGSLQFIPAPKTLEKDLINSIRKLMIKYNWTDLECIKVVQRIFRIFVDYGFYKGFKEANIACYIDSKYTKVLNDITVNPILHASVNYSQNELDYALIVDRLETDIDNILIDDKGLMYKTLETKEYYRPMLLDSTINIESISKGVILKDMNLIRCDYCSNHIIPPYIENAISAEDEKVKICSRCVIEKFQYIKVTGKNSSKYIDVNNINIYYDTHGNNYRKIYIPTKKDLLNFCLIHGVRLNNSRLDELISINIDYDVPESLESLELSDYKISYELIKLIHDLSEKFDISLRGMYENIIHAFKELKANWLYLRRDSYFYYLPENREIEDIEELETKGMKSKKWTNLFRMIFNTDDSRLLENCTRFAKNRLSNIKELASAIEITDKIEDIYRDDILNSCMSGEKYVRFYESAGDIKIAYMRNKDDEVIARALLWHGVLNVNSENGEKINVMDRIYTLGDQTDEITKAFKHYAKVNGYYHRAEQNYCTKTRFVDPENQEEIILELRFTCDSYLDEYEFFPYIDSFTYGKDNYLQNFSRGTIHEFDRTDGTGLEGIHTCDHCEERYYEDDLAYVEGYGSVCSSCLDSSDDFFYCDHCSEYHYNVKEYHLNDGGRGQGYRVCENGLSEYDYVLDHKGDPIHIDNAIIIDQEWYHIDDIEGKYFYCEGSGEYCFFENCEYIQDNEGHFYSEYADQYEEIKTELENNKQLTLEGIA